MEALPEVEMLPRSFDELVAASRHKLLRLGLMLSGNPHSAEDLVQSVFTRAFRHRSRVESADSPEAYLRTMVVNEFLGWRRLLSSREHPVAELYDDPVADDPNRRVAERDAAWRLLATLPRTQRAVLVLRYYEDLPDAEIAAVLGCAASTVRSNASRALATLRADLPGLEETR
jgi:RNA polymerase sigma-70 factor (sigma-E family)